jgi:hypothetical protein
VVKQRICQESLQKANLVFYETQVTPCTLAKCRRRDPDVESISSHDVTPCYSVLSLLTSGCRWSERRFRGRCTVGGWLQEVAEPPPRAPDASTSPPGRRGRPLLWVLKPHRSLQVVSLQSWVRVQHPELPAVRTCDAVVQGVRFMMQPLVAAFWATDCHITWLAV